MKKDEVEKILEFVNNELDNSCISKEHISEAVFEAAILISNSFPRESDITLHAGKPERTEFCISVYLYNGTIIDLLLEWCKEKESWFVKLNDIVINFGIL